jgi:hypothetical protein
MKKILLLAALFLTVQLQAQITGLSGWNIVIDPGHSADENMGIYNYPEAQKSLYGRKTSQGVFAGLYRY